VKSPVVVEKGTKARCTARVGGADFHFGIGDLVCSRAPSELAAQKQTSGLGEDLVNERKRLVTTL
jgi:hypothetical protein